MRFELHIYLDKYPANTLHSYTETLEALENHQLVVNTTNTYFCKTEYIEKGYSLFIHFADGTKTQIKFGFNESCNKELRKAHNIEKMMYANAFGDVM